MHPSDIFNSNDFPPIDQMSDPGTMSVLEHPTGSRPSSRKRQVPREPNTTTTVPAAPPTPAFKALCGMIGRLLARIVGECATGADNYDRVAEWFSKWLHSMGIAVRFVRRAPNDYVDSPHFTGFCTRIADSVRSAFFLYEDVGTELVNKMRGPKYRQVYKPGMACISDFDAGRLAAFIETFLASSNEMFTFDRFVGALSNAQ